jgi:hypothetical protein
MKGGNAMINSLKDLFKKAFNEFNAKNASRML